MKKVLLTIGLILTISLIYFSFKNNKFENNKSSVTSNNTTSSIEQECSFKKDLVYDIIYDKTHNSEEANEVSMKVYKECVRKSLGDREE